MRRLTACVLAACLLPAACGGPTTPGPADDPSGPNTLTAAERAAGWRLLFDGSDDVRLARISAIGDAERLAGR